VPAGPVRHVPTYGERAATLTAAGPSGTEGEQMDRLKALGYLDDSGAERAPAASSPEERRD
jgi:hypothetical protein